MNRPYRSHLHPACTACRRRKSRCRSDETNTACLMCQVHGTTCDFPRLPPRSSKSHNRSELRASSQKVSSTLLQPPQPPGSPSMNTRKAASRRHRNAIRNQQASFDPSSDFTPSIGSSIRSASGHEQIDQRAGMPDLLTRRGGYGPESAHIIGPTAADDAHVLRHYLGNDPQGSAGRTIQPVPMSISAGVSNSTPLYFNTISNQPLGILLNQQPSYINYQIVENLVDPNGRDLLNLYFERANPCFPIIDKASFLEQSYCNAEDFSKASPALRTSLYASSMVLWPHLHSARRRKCPNIPFIWFQAEQAIRSELLLSPGMSTVLALLLTIGGRPTTSLIGNAVSLGAAVSLAHVLGLNRDPTDWKVPCEEKRLRVQLWWAIVIHDRWYSLAYGTPPLIDKAKYDVPSPTEERSRGILFSVADRVTLSSFMAFASLTEVLDRTLEVIYTLKAPHEPNMKISRIAGLSNCLKEWKQAQNSEVQSIIESEQCLDLRGSANIRLAYLSILLLIKRLELNEAIDEKASETKCSQLKYAAQTIAEQIVTFIENLEDQQIYDYWHPTSAFSIASACTFLIRCALEGHACLGQSFVLNVELSRPRDLINALKRHKREYDWDVGDICVSQCEMVLSNIQSNSQHEDSRGNEATEAYEDTLYQAFLDDELFPNMWNIFDGLMAA